MKHKIYKGKIYVIPMPIYGVLKHFVEDFKFQFILPNCLGGPNRQCWYSYRVAGRSGLATGIHLQLGAKYKGKSFNPEPLFDYVKSLK